MITGQNSFTIDWRDWLRGMTTSDEVQDGGFSQQTTAVNLIAEPGVINAPGLVTSISGLTDEIIASASDPLRLGEDKILLDDSGKFYSYDDPSLTTEATGAGTKLYSIGVTQMVTFNGKWYATNSIAAGNTGDIAELSGTTGAMTLVEDWWTNASHLNQSAMSGNPSSRPMLVWENTMWVADHNVLYAISTGEAVTTALTLNSGDSITALGIDKGTGKMLIATTTGADASATRKGEDKILIYDGSSDKADRVVLVNGTVTAFHNLSSSTIVFYDNYMGTWTGRGIKFLRKLNMSLVSTELAYPHKITSIGDTLYVVDGGQILAYGQVIGGQGPLFYYALRNGVNANDYTHVSNLGSGILGVSMATSLFYTFDTTAIAQVMSGGAKFYTRRYDFKKKVLFKGLRMQFKTLPTVTGSRLFTMHVIDDTGTVTTLAQPDTTTGEIELDLPSTDREIVTSSLQFYWLMAPTVATNVSSLRRMVAYHDPAQE